MNREKPADDPNACAAIRMANRCVTQLYDLVLAPTGMKATQFIILQAIDENGQIAQCEFAREYAIAIETLSRRLGTLRRKGLIELQTVGQHGQRIYALTEKGRQRLEYARPYWLGAQHRLREVLGDSDWQKLHEICARICVASEEAENLKISNHPPSRAA